jgi:hypothetical protein
MVVWQHSGHQVDRRVQFCPTLSFLQVSLTITVLNKRGNTETLEKRIDITSLWK